MQLTGAMLALGLVRIDENFAARVLGITTSITFICALIGIYSAIDFSFLQGTLFFALGAFIVANTVRFFIKIPNEGQRLTAFFGVLIFVGYLLVDFDRLERLQMAGKNTWQVAMDVSINIYLDIINLFLELLELLVVPLQLDPAKIKQESRSKDSTVRRCVYDCTVPGAPEDDVPQTVSPSGAGQMRSSSFR